jgi:hypothetical protein
MLSISCNAFYLIINLQLIHINIQFVLEFSICCDFINSVIFIILILQR